MCYIVARRIVAALSFAAACHVAAATGHPPLTLRDPVFGLRIELSKASLDALPNDVLSRCPELANDQESMRLWVYGATVDAGRRYFVVGGYYIRLAAQPRGGANYSLDTRGVVFYVQGDKCTLIGPARETFDARFLKRFRSPFFNSLLPTLRNASRARSAEPRGCASNSNVRNCWRLNYRSSYKKRLRRSSTSRLNNSM